MAEVQDIVPPKPQGMQPWLQIPPAVNQQPPLPPPDQQSYSDILGAMQAQQAKNQQLQAGNIVNNLKQQQLMTEQPVQTNLQSLMSTVDAWTGSHMAKDYTPPETPLAREALLQKMQEQVDKNSNNMTEQQVQMLKSQLEVQMHKEEQELKLQMLQATREQTNAFREQGREDLQSQRGKVSLEGAQKGWNNDENVKKTISEAQEIKTNDDLIEAAHAAVSAGQPPPNPVALQAIPVTLARMIVNNRINTAEIDKMGGSNKVTDKLQQIADTAMSGKMSDANYQYLKQIVNIMKDSNDQQIANLAYQHAGQYSKVSGKPIEESIGDLTGGVYGPELLDKVRLGTKGAAKSPQAKSFQPGQILPGAGGKKYKFLGGDPNDQKNYEEVP